jgi:hypothetical protein
MSVRKEETHRHRSMSNAPGSHTNDFNKVKSIYEKNPLTKEMKELIRQKTGSTGLTKLRPFIKLFIQQSDSLPQLKRLEYRQEFGLLSYVSKNWNLLRTFFESNQAEGNNTSDFEKIFKEIFFDDSFDAEWFYYEENYFDQPN